MIWGWFNFLLPDLQREVGNLEWRNRGFSGNWKTQWLPCPSRTSREEHSAANIGRSIQEEPCLTFIYSCCAIPNDTPSMTPNCPLEEEHLDHNYLVPCTYTPSPMPWRRGTLLPRPLTHCMSLAVTHTRFSCLPSTVPPCGLLYGNLCLLLSRVKWQKVFPSCHVLSGLPRLSSHPCDFKGIPLFITQNWRHK